MAIRSILKEGDEALRRKSRDVLEFDKRLHLLLDDMKETMYKYDGVGLAAPQIGVLRKVIVLDDGNDYYEMINPEIIASNGSQYGVEGCLSCPNQFGMVERPNYIEVVGFDRNGNNFKVEAKGFLARIFCHEIDHLHGIIFKDIAKKLLTPKEAYEITSKGEIV